jgi:hypothetical protein
MGMKQQFLIYCTYEYYCQGYEDTQGYFLVTATSFEEACGIIRINLRNARNFENKTL